MLKLIFGAYEKREIKELSLIPASPTQRAYAFNAFVEEAVYKELSAERRLFGLPSLAKRAVLNFDRLADTISAAILSGIYWL
jgi:hypothetical protein